MIGKPSFRIERLRAVSSTNDVVRERLLAGEPSGLVVVAETQTRGRGRQGRPWSSPIGNLYLSILLRPDRPAREWPSLSLVIGLSLAEAIGSRAKLKWPNDVLIDQAKTAGILLEGEDEALIVGIGVNIVSHPEGLDYPTTSLQAAGIDHSKETVLDALMDRLDRNLVSWERHGFEAMRSAWLHRGPQIGETMMLRQGHVYAAAHFNGIAEDGSLLVTSENGQRKVRSADSIMQSSS